MAIVRRLGSPDFFITMTSNPNWPEIKKALQINLEDGTILQQLPQDRPDIVARAAKLKFDQLIEDLDKKTNLWKSIGFCIHYRISETRITTYASAYKYVI
ncbi:jg22426 [Pararge aegeria aegeria]|uniref:Jg22426 protein n=1 Tax=Pararge aegeria aegeria TaxID=348720 RepID=A0A8S4QXJ8_9NEOP|nr:jg22426 [Pararge aegeria aegeria]